MPANSRAFGAAAQLDHAPSCFAVTFGRSVTAVPGGTDSRTAYHGRLGFVTLLLGANGNGPIHMRLPHGYLPQPRPTKPHPGAQSGVPLI